MPQLKQTTKALILLTCALALSARAVADSVQRIDVPAGDLLAAIESIAKQSDVELVYQPDKLKGLKTAGVSGNLTTQDAVKKLLEGTELRVSLDASTGAMLIVPKDQSPVKISANVAAGRPLQLASARPQSMQSDASQSAGGRAQNTAEEESPGAGSGDKVQEIIVTATKRAENIQDVPMSITAIGRDEIERRGLVNAQDYLRGIPGVNQVGEGSMGGQAIVIRGLETTLQYQNFSSGTTTGTYFGETPTTNSAGLGGGSNVDIKLVDIERVEVLRGPQGTAFGNSSLGGTVRTIPVAPKLDRVEGSVMAGYSFTSGTGGDNQTIQGVGNLPLIKDKLAIRAAAYRFQDSGFYRNRAGSDVAFKAAAATPYGADAFAVDDDEVGETRSTGGRIAALYQASEDLRFTLGYLTQKTDMDGFAFARTGTYEQAILQVAPEHVRRGQKGGVNDYDIGIANAVMEYDLGWADLLATYSDVQSSSVSTYPYTAFGTNLPVSVDGPSDHREHVGEIRLATKLDGAWNFLGGLYAEEVKDKVVYDIVWHGDLALNPIAPGVRLLGNRPETRDLKQKAAFGEASWKFLPGFTLTGGVRAYEYDRSFRVDTVPSPYYGPDGTHQGGEAKTSGTTFRANLSYQPADGALLYASWAQGFRLGSPQPGLAAGLCDRDNDGIADGTNITLESTRSVDPDEVDSYELGGKFAFPGSGATVSAAVFRMEWSGVPSAVMLGSASALCGGIIYTENVGSARNEGVEVQTNVPLSDSIRADFGGSYIRARLTKDVPAQGVTAGDRLPGSPKVNANLGLQYAFDIAGYPGSVRADAIYVGTFYSAVPQSPATESGDYVKLDASARVTIKNLNVDLYARNLTNEDAFTFHLGGQYYGYRMRPRTIGLQLGYSF